MMPMLTFYRSASPDVTIKQTPGYKSDIEPEVKSSIRQSPSPLSLGYPQYQPFDIEEKRQWSPYATKTLPASPLMSPTV